MHDYLFCPYCSKEVTPDLSEMYEEDNLYQEECEHCGKHFAVTVHQSFSYDTKEVDCWNGKEHDWSPWHAHHPKEDFTKIFETRYCYTCSEREQGMHDVTDSEQHQRIIKMYKEINERNDKLQKGSA